MIENDKPAQEECWERFKYEHVSGLGISSIEEGLDVGNDGFDKGNGRAEPEDFSGHSSGNHECFGFGLVLV